MNKKKRQKKIRNSLVRGGVMCCLIIAGFGVFQLVHAGTQKDNTTIVNEESNLNTIKIEQTALSNNKKENIIEEEIIEEEENAAEIMLAQVREKLPTSAELTTDAVLQLPELPTGCESVALTMALESLGYSLEKTTIAEEYLVLEEENFAIGYVGDPASEDGAGIFGPGLTKTANNFLAANENKQVAVDLTGIELTELYPYLAAGYPVVMWTTMYFKEPYFTDIYAEYEGKSYQWYSNEHCVLLGGYDLEENTVKIFDPLQGEVTVDIPTVQDIFEKTGKNTIAILQA